MRKIETHKVNPANDRIGIVVVDEPGAGGANHHYAIDIGLEGDNGVDLHFQNGPIAVSGVNGITQEVLLAIVIDRLECFQAGPYACHENAMALESIRAAQDWLHSRTKLRMERGVEGTHTV